MKIKLVINKDLIGYSNFKFVNNKAYINYLFVNKNYRNKGHGKTLLSLSENYFKSLLYIDQIILHTRINDQNEYLNYFYIKQGYIRKQTDNIYDDGEFIHDIYEFKKWI